MAEKQFPLSVVIRAIDRVTAPMARIQRGVLAFDQGLRARMGGLLGRLSTFGRMASDRMGLPVFGAALGRVGSALGDLGRRAAIVGGAIGSAMAGSAAAALGLVQSFADSAGQINDVSTSIGVSAEALQEWRYAAKQNGVEAELLDKSMQLLARNFGEAKAGKGQAKDVLEAMGLNPKKFKNVEQLVPALADKLAKISDPMVRASVAAKLFGRSGVQLIPMLKDGSKGLSEYAAAARRLGVVISNEAIAQADDFGDKFDDLKLSLTGVRNIIGTQLLPVMTDLISKMTDWIVTKGPQINAFFKDFAAKLPDRLAKLRDGLQEVKDKLQPLIDGFEWLSEKFGSSNVVIGLLATALTLYLVPALVATTSAFYALGVAMLTTPVGWVLLAIAAIAGAVYLIYDSWDEITQFWTDWWEGVKGVFDAVVGFFSGIWNDITEGFEGGFLNGMINLFETLNPVNLIIRAFTELLPRMKQAVAPFLSWFKGGFLGALTPDWMKNLMGLNAPKVPAPAQSRAADGAKKTAAAAARGSGDGSLLMAQNPAAAATKAAARAAPAAAARGNGDGGMLRLQDRAPAAGAANVAKSVTTVQRSEARVQVDFNNLPRGARVSSETSGRTQFDLNQGYALGTV
ncbi:MAG TPA: hypothetical protein VGE09_11240 [Pseudoxanthomonas sp.]